MFSEFDKLKEEVELRFTYSAPKSQKEIDTYVALRNQIKALAMFYIDVAIDCKELREAITLLETASMKINAAIARRGLREDEKNKRNR